MKHKKYLTTAVKYLFALLLTFAGLKNFKYPGSLLLSMGELFSVIFLSDVLLRKSKYFNVLNSILILLYNAQMLVLFFGGSFITLVMLQNLASVQDLAGKLFIYSLGIILVLVFSFLPVKPTEYIGPLKTEKISLFAGLFLIIIRGILLFVFPGGETPLGGYIDLSGQYKDHRQLLKMVELNTRQNDTETDVLLSTLSTEADFSADEASQDTEEEKISGTILVTNVEESPKNVAHPVINGNPNVILIFTEGLSQNIVSDERGIMPNVAKLEGTYLSFENYYNHTFATYRGIQGQLFSGHQLNDTDKNNLPSLMSVLKKRGYYTEMINTEPANEMFTGYLRDLGFDECIEKEPPTENLLDALTDAQAYDLLFDEAERLENDATPFFLCIYTFGTHVSLDSPDHKFGDGENNVLNRFYNADMQFGNFMDKLRESGLDKDTLVVFTGDHATFSDEDYKKAFPEYERACSDVDEVPLLFIFEGLSLQVDAAGRNSLDMAPTLLDLLGLTSPDSFMGTSLFEKELDNMAPDKYFWDPTYMKYTGNDSVEDISGNTASLIFSKIAKYLADKKVPQ
ncbi:MAG: sulfatase-like hydrolase/transferase [Lachnospiraceae bacterium]|nr:sulfatase-like hydrolase/transferase [Lachnospiraceae bacterium]